MKMRKVTKDKQRSKISLETSKTRFDGWMDKFLFERINTWGKDKVA